MCEQAIPTGTLNVEEECNGFFTVPKGKRANDLRSKTMHIHASGSGLGDKA